MHGSICLCCMLHPVLWPTSVTCCCRLSANSALLLKLAGTLAWPCISAAAIMQAQQTAQISATLPFAGVNVLVSLSSVVLQLSMFYIASSVLWLLVRRQADVQHILSFGKSVGVICVLQAALNATGIVTCAIAGKVAVKSLGKCHRWQMAYPSQAECCCCCFLSCTAGMQCHCHVTTGHTCICMMLMRAAAH